MVQSDLSRKLDQFKDFPPEFKEFCVSHGTLHQYSSKQFLYLAGDDPTKLFILLNGSVQLILANEFVEKIYRVVKAPALFPEVVLDGKAHIHSALTAEPAEVLTLDLRSVQMFLSRHPETYKFFFQQLALDFRRANRQIRNLSSGDARVRIGAKLYALSRAHGRRTAEGIEITIPLSTTDLAGMCGLARESASRILTELRDLDLIKSEKKTLVITNVEGLREWIYERAHRK